ncbi:hypothetical protein [Nocardia sp. NPDC047654]|uniref:hypothetical protein n=1 Tax=Nocardia sp. NPDC047654 TaxID=3364314 RepID=UPI003723EEEA
MQDKGISTRGMLGAARAPRITTMSRLSIFNELGQTPVGFGINADFGATASATEVQSAMNAAAPGAIAPAHMHRPHSGTAAGMVAALPKIRAVGFIFVRL